MQMVVITKNKTWTYSIMENVYYINSTTWNQSIFRQFQNRLPSAIMLTNFIYIWLVTSTLTLATFVNSNIHVW